MPTTNSPAGPPVIVNFEGVRPDGAVHQLKASFNDLREARAFRDELNRAIAAADPRGADQPDAFAESVDAQEWARAFLERFDLELVNGETVDEGLLIGWFANAIERGSDAGAKAWPAQPRLPDVVRVVREAAARARVEVDGRPFPWALGWPAVVQVDGRDRPGVTLRLLARRVELVDSIAPVERGGE